MGSQTPSMRVTGWSNGEPRPSGAGYGVRLAGHDRDEYFDPGWQEVIVTPGRGETVSVALSRSFWRLVQSFEALPSGGGFSAIASHHGFGACLRHWSCAT